LIGLDNVETFFHEFGHALHQVLSQTQYTRHAGTNVERDFVEAPSQMLEAWAYDKRVLDKFASHWEDPSKKIDADLLQKIIDSRLATKAFWYRRQLAFGTMDMRFHLAGENKDTAQIGRETMKEVFLATPSNTNYVASFGHMFGGYDAGYYGYAWADVISQDLLSAFKASPDGLLDREIGRKLRKEIYEMGSSRSADESVNSFLGREWTKDSFLKEMGIE